MRVKYSPRSCSRCAFVLDFFCFFDCFLNYFLWGICIKRRDGWPATRLGELFIPGFQSSHGKRRTTQRRRARRRLAARRSFALTSVKAVGQSLRVLLLDVPLSSSTEELEGQTPEKAEKRQTQYQRSVARFCLNSALVRREEPRRPRF